MFEAKPVSSLNNMDKEINSIVPLTQNILIY